jgi:hypothetical protein
MIASLAALCVAYACNDHPTVGEPIPGNVVADTTFLSGVITGTRTFASDSVYVLQSDVVVGDSATAGELVIEAGAEIRGMSGATLIVSRNGRIVADGTSQAPIRMVCHGTAPSPGCWEGLVIAGSAPLNAGEGGLGSAPEIPVRNDGGGGDQRTIAGVPYGGANAADSSGVLRHVVVEDAGDAGRGIALAGVGSGTVIDGVQSNRSDAVGIEVLGGSVNMAHVLVTAPATSGLAFSLGYDGAAQYVAVQMDPGASDGTAVRVTNAPGEPSATPATAPELWNLTVIGGTAFFREHRALVFEDAGGAVRNALLVQAAVGVEANAGACSLFSLDDLDVDHVVMLGTTESVVSASCASGITAALEAGEVDGLGNSRVYMGDLEDPFDGELLDMRPSDALETEAVPATPSGGLDPNGELFGAAEGGSSNVPWYTGWSGTWERSDGLASLPEPVGFSVPPEDTLLLSDPDGFVYQRRQAGLRLSGSATPSEVADLFESFGLQIVGWVRGIYVVQWPDPGTNWATFDSIRVALRAHPAVQTLTNLYAPPIRDGLYPLDGAARSRTDWGPGVPGFVQNWKDVRAPQAWMCENGEQGSTTVRAAIIERDYAGERRRICDAIPRSWLNPVGLRCDSRLDRWPSSCGVGGYAERWHRSFRAVSHRLEHSKPLGSSSLQLSTSIQGHQSASGMDL